MAMLVEFCPRCRTSKITLDILSATPRGTSLQGWQFKYEIFVVCRNCHKSTVFEVYLSDYEAREAFSNTDKLLRYPNSINDFFRVVGYISEKDMSAASPPEFVPTQIANAFAEGSSCLAMGCWNAAAAMFRLAIDLSTCSLLPDPAESAPLKPTAHERRNLAPRLRWLFDNNIIPEALRDLSSCVKDDGDFGAHEGNLTKVDSEDLFDFTYTLLERLYTEPRRIENARQRQASRRRAIG